MVAVTHRWRRVRTPPVLLTVSWTITLLSSALPTILWQAFTGHAAPWLVWMRITLLATLVLLGTLWRPLRPLRPYCGIVLVLILAESLLAQLGRTPPWQHWFGGAPSFVTAMLGGQILRLGVAGIMLGALFALHYRGRDAFLGIGHLDAPAAPVRWLGMARATPWRRFGRILALTLSGGTLAFLVLAGRPSPALLLRALPVLPAVMVLAAMNAFGEELSYRAALLAPLHRVIGDHHALLMTAVFFGLGHYAGVPYGVSGVVMASVLGWLLGKSMLETRGCGWAWCIHFWQDVWIFTFLAVGSITVGGA